MDAEKILQGLRDSDMQLMAAGLEWDQYVEIGPPSGADSTAVPIILARLGATLFTWLPGEGEATLRLHKTAEDAKTCFDVIETEARAYLASVEMLDSIRTQQPQPSQVTYYA